MEQQNILMVVVDQLAARALEGKRETPNLDRLREMSQSAECCITQCPLCQPSRASFWSGLYPHETNVLSNGRKWPANPVSSSVETLGRVLSKAGYETRHFGKRHDAGALGGFWCAEEGQTVIPDAPSLPYNFDTYNDVFTHKQALDFLRARQSSRPLAMVVDLVNPHNICGWVGLHKDGRPDEETEGLPELPPNFEFDDIANRGTPVQYLCCTHIRQGQASHWSPLLFRQYLKAYQGYLALADRMIGDVLNAWRDKGLGGYILFWSDHGDAMASRHMVTKDVCLYREAVEVPLFISGPDVKPGTLRGLAELLDIAPTVCGLLGLRKPASFQGKDLSGLLREGGVVDRPYAVSQWHTEWGYTVSPCRLVRTQGASYIRYLEPGVQEEYYDLASDPFEEHNAASSHPGEVAMMRCLFTEYLRESHDPFESLAWNADRRWRSHELGFCHHEGPTAPEAGK